MEKRGTFLYSFTPVHAIKRLQFGSKTEPMKACVFIQTNHKQITGAIVAEHALRRYSQNND